MLCDSFFFMIITFCLGGKSIKTKDFYREVKETSGVANKMKILTPGKKLVNIENRQFKLASGSSLNRSN